jgi:hypothetical protein
MLFGEDAPNGIDRRLSPDFAGKLIEIIAPWQFAGRFNERRDGANGRLSPRAILGGLSIVGAHNDTSRDFEQRRSVRMAKLSLEQIPFLHSQRISLRELFDASGMKKADYQSAMEDTGQHFAYGVTPCVRGGHALRTKAGHCIQCDTSKISYALRNSKNATVYIAGSTDHRIIKVGLTTDRARRLSQINEYKYGGSSDWEMLAWVQSATAGRVEFEAQNRLQRARRFLRSEWQKAGMLRTV